MRYRCGRSSMLTLAICLILLLFAGCQQERPGQTTEPTTEPLLPSYSVSFQVNDAVCSQQLVGAGSTPAPVVPEITGLHFQGWVDADGNAVTPQSEPVYADTVYYAQGYPDISAHVPYLFADESGFLRPEDALTAQELSLALHALAADGAEQFFPSLPDGTEPVTQAQLREVLSAYFPGEAVTQAMTAVQSIGLTRAAFASVMNTLTQRGTETGLTPAEDAAWAMDLSAALPAYIDLMEAYVSHTHGTADRTWQEAAGQLQYAPGFRNCGGWLYYIGEDGMAVRDTQVGKLTFGADGRYTSGDAQLDATVAEILNGILQANPDAERIDLLRRAFEYTRDSFTYLRRNGYEFGQTGWEIEDAKRMFSTLHGNCYNFAAAFWALARGLGYEAVGVCGTMTRTDQPHGWVEIVIDGTPYIFDPEMEYVYWYERDVFDKDMFMVTYAAGNWWNYKRPDGLHD